MSRTKRILDQLDLKKLNNRLSELTGVEQKKEKKRQALLESAYELFTTIGYQDTTILQIAVKAGVAKGSFYNYFDDKEAIRDELIVIISSHILTDAVNSLERKLEDPEADGMTFPDKLVFITDHIITNLSRDIARLKFISKSLSWGILSQSDSYRSKYGDVIDFRAFVMESLKRENIKLTSPELVIFTIIELISSTCYSVILSGEPVTFSDYKPYLYRCIRLLIDDATVRG